MRGQRSSLCPPPDHMGSGASSTCCHVQLPKPSAPSQQLQHVSLHCAPADPPPHPPVQLLTGPDRMAPAPTAWLRPGPHGSDTAWWPHLQPLWHHSQPGITSITFTFEILLCALYGLLSLRSNCCTNLSPGAGVAVFCWNIYWIKRYTLLKGNFIKLSLMAGWCSKPTELTRVCCVCDIKHNSTNKPTDRDSLVVGVCLQAERSWVQTPMSSVHL